MPTGVVRRLQNGAKGLWQHTGPKKLNPTRAILVPLASSRHLFLMDADPSIGSPKTQRAHCPSNALSQSIQEILALSGRSHRSPRLEAFPAKYWSPLGWPERHRGLFSTLRARGLRFSPHRGCITSAPAATLCALGFAAFASLRFVLKALVGEKHLFAGCKYKLGTAFRTLQHPIVEFHERSPWDPFRAVGRGQTCTWILGREVYR